MISACYPVVLRNEKPIWSGAPLHGPGVDKATIEAMTQAKAERAFARGVQTQKKGDVPSFLWLQVDQDALFRNNAETISPKEAAEFRKLRDQEPDQTAEVTQ